MSFLEWAGVIFHIALTVVALMLFIASYSAARRRDYASAHRQLVLAILIAIWTQI